MTLAQPNKRLLSLDFLRGFIMVLLMMDSTGLYDFLEEKTRGTALHALAQQFVHHPWNGLRFWDLVQPVFMFVAGTAMAFSLYKQRESGMSWNQSFRKALRRSGWLFFWGVLDYAVRPTGLSFELWDVLTQLAFTSLVAFLVFNWKYSTQILFCAALLILTEVLYRYSYVPGFDQPFTDQHNFGNYFDWILMHKINQGGWVAINCLPTAVHTIAGALAGKSLLSERKKIQPLLFAGLFCLLAGYGLDMAGITPIIKRIATSSFTLASLGWCLLMLTACYWWIDMKQHKNRLAFFTIVGMNSIFIFVFFEIVGARWFNGYIDAIAGGVLSWFNVGESARFIAGCCCVFALEWGLCYFLYRKKIFFKL
ncbi:MAG TPA: DUF5009 domain-containing protein [Chitinophagaceae bacterium]|nr:DUF5009 domain-containing protein [Chitinophagaceae bacterium]